MKWDIKTVLWVHVLNPRMMSVGDNDNRQTNRQMCSSQEEQTYIKRAEMKWDIKTVLGVHVLNPRMMSVGDNDNIQTNRQMFSSQQEQTHIKSVHKQLNHKVCK